LIVAVTVLAYLPLTRPPSDQSVVWSVAIQVLYTGQVTRIFQSHHFDVTLELKNGTVLTTKEPTIDAISYELRKCGDPCKNIVFATE
jgi:hypothetical protein